MKTLSCPNKACPLASARSIICYASTHQLREAPSIQVPELREDILREHRHTLPSAPTSSRDLRRSRRTQRGGPEQVCNRQVKQIAWNTVARWLERAAHSCRRFNDRRIATLAVAELQADEIRTIVGSKEHPIWIFTTIDVWSRLWPATVIGRRSYRNTLALIQDVAGQMNLERVPMIVTDGFQFYKRVVRRIFGPACLYAQVIKTRRNDRIIKVERRMLIGDTWRFEERLRDSEDSSKLNTSFVAAEPHDPTGLGLSFSADDLPRAMEGASRRSPGVASLLIQLLKA